MRFATNCGTAEPAEFSFDRTGVGRSSFGEAGVVAIFCKKLLAGEPARINGDGRYVRDYVFGPDVARANVLALTADLPSVVPGSLTSLNIGTALGTDVNALEELNRAAVATVLARAGRGAVLPLPEHGPSRPGDLRSNLVDATLAGRVLGWAGSRLSVSVRDCR